MSEITISENDARMFDDVRRAHLRHPGMVPKRVVNLLKLTSVTPAHINAVRTEWLRLGLNQTKGTQHV